MAIHSSILARRILRTEGTGGLRSMGLQRVPDDQASEHIACGILVPQPGTEPSPWVCVLRAQSLIHWTTKKSPCLVFFFFFSFLIIGLAYGLCCSLRVLNCNSMLFPYKPVFAGKITVLFLRSTEVLGLCSQNSPIRPAWFIPFYSEA